MRASTAYFAGAGTVIAAIVGGIGGGLLFADMVSPKTSKLEMTRLEQRMSAQPIEVKAAPEPAASPAAPPSTTAAVPAVAAPEQRPAQSAAAAPAAPSPAQVTALPASERPPSQNVVSTPASAAEAPAAAPQPATQRQAATAPEDSLAKAKDVDLKRAAADKRRAERRQQWSEKRRYQRRDEQELLEVEARVREATETRPAFASEPVRDDGPRIRLFGLD